MDRARQAREARREDREIGIDAALVRCLLREQFPELADLDVRPVQPGGWDNRSFRVGDRWVARLPSDAVYAVQPQKERDWLPVLAAHLPLEIPRPIARGVPGCGYSWDWSVLEWIDGETPSQPHAHVADQLASFLIELQSIDAAGGPAPGPENFHRGGNLAVYDDQVKRALTILEGRVDERAALELWKAALVTRWDRRPVWVHGDISPGNLLSREDRLVAVLDFGNLAAGDPACDLAIAWSWFDEDARDRYRTILALDDGTWLRGRAWALWKALVVAAGLSPTNAVDYQDPLAVVSKCLLPKT